MKCRGGARKEEIDFSRMAGHDCFMMKWFHILFLGGAFCWGNANAGVRMADVLTDDRPERLMEMAAAEIGDSASCRKAAEQLNAEAGRQEKLWREALMSGSPTPQEWVQISEVE